MSHELVWTKLVNFMGPSKARAVMGEVLEQIGLVELRDANDRLMFGSAMIDRGGANEFIGRTIALQARLHGARD